MYVDGSLSNLVFVYTNPLKTLILNQLNLVFAYTNPLKTLILMAFFSLVIKYNCIVMP